MKKFQFKPEVKASTFTGYAFYNIYKGAEFLKNNENIETILSKGYQLRLQLHKLEPGATIAVAGMNLTKNTPLLVKRTGPGVVVEDYEFTNNRLTGLAAAYAFEKHRRFPSLTSSEADVLGLTWNHKKTGYCKLYLSAVTGAEHFYEQFSFWPLICGLRKLHLKKITPEPVIKMAKIKNNNGERLASVFSQNLKTVKKVWAAFPGSKLSDLERLLKYAPSELKSLLDFEELSLRLQLGLLK